MTPPFRHSATVERNVATGRDAWRAPVEPEFAVLNADQECDYWATDEDLLTGPNVNAAIEVDRMLVPKTADVTVGDEIPEVRDELGTPISTGRLKVIADLRMEPSHRELRLELASAPTPPEGS